MFDCKRDLGIHPTVEHKITRCARRPVGSEPLTFSMRQSSGTPPFASISNRIDDFLRNLPWNRHQQPSSTAGQIEPKTGTEFAPRYCQRGNAHCGSLAGVGCRSKRLAGVKNINVYAVGLYADEAGVRNALRKYRSKSAEAAVKDQSFYDALVKADNVEKTLHMRISFGHVSASQFWEAIEAQLAGPMKEAGADATLQEFGRTFDNVKFRKGLPLSFCISKGGNLTSKVEGKDMGTIKSQALCQSLLNVYVGKKPVSTDAKESIGRGLAAMLEK